MDNPLNAVGDTVKKLPKPVVIGAVGIGAGLGVILLIRNRNAPERANNNDGTITDPYGLAYDNPSPVPIDYAGGGITGGVSSGIDPNTGQPYVQTGTSGVGIPWSDILDVWKSGFEEGKTTAPVGGGNDGAPSSGSVGTDTPAPLTPPEYHAPTPLGNSGAYYDYDRGVVVTPPPSLQASAGAASKPPSTPPASSPGGITRGDPKPDTWDCPKDYPFHGPNKNSCYRLVLKGSGKNQERWHYYRDGSKKRVS